VRPRDGAKPLEVAAIKRALEDKRMWCGLGVVVKRDGDASHFENEVNDSGSKVDVLVEIDLMPEAIPVTARLGCGAGSLGAGGWKIPKPGAEVIWMAPHGEMESDIMIVGTLSTNSVPSALDEDTFVLVQPKNLIIASQDASGKVYLGSADGTGTQPIHRKGDHGSVGTLTITAAGTTVVQVTYVDPDGNTIGPIGANTPANPFGAVIQLKSKATEGASNAEAK